MNFIKQYTLPLVVFLTGACVLVIEIVATRILSPYFGNTIFTVSSVISTVLAALSIGYYVGGKLADKYPKEKVFYSIILMSGISVIFLQFLKLFFLPLIGYKLSITSGPIVAACILFFLPSILLGTLSPFAIKLQAQRFPEKGLGSISGEMFFWSTLGSIVGSLKTGFILIPVLGINQIIFAVATVLIALGLFPLIHRIFKKKSFLISSVILFIGIIVLSKASSITSTKVKTLYTKDGIYERITIYDGKYTAEPARFFQQDRSTSGGMFLNSDKSLYPYSDYYALYKIFKPEVKQALIIGGGAYTIPKLMLHELPNAYIDVSEIEPSLFELAKKYFKLPNSQRITNYTDDGRRLLHDTNKKYDLIFSDVYYSLFSIPVHFTTQEFFQLAKNKLSTDGIFVANLIGTVSRQEPSLIMSEIKTFQTIFPNSYFFAVDSPIKSGSQNIIFIGYNSTKKIDFNQLSTNDIFLKSLKQKQINPDRFELSPYPILTDNYAPIDTLTGDLLQKKFYTQESIDGKEMMAIINQQLRYGPRYINAIGHKKTQQFLKAEMDVVTNKTTLQTWHHTNKNGTINKLTNIIGQINPENEKRIILATHYDSKKFATKDVNNTQSNMPGANDSASGVAVLVEIARLLNNAEKTPTIGVDFVFFDGEEGETDIKEDYTYWEPLGSTYFAKHIQEIYPNQKPIGGVVLDMVCEKDLSIAMEKSSIDHAPYQVKTFMNIGRKINPDTFSEKKQMEIQDDHTPLNAIGIPSFLVIDFEYKYFHTSQDTIDKCSEESLETIAKTVIEYIYTIQ